MTATGNRPTTWAAALSMDGIECLVTEEGTQFTVESPDVHVVVLYRDEDSYGRVLDATGDLSCVVGALNDVDALWRRRDDYPDYVPIPRAAS
jgi:hypothetical protein